MSINPFEPPSPPSGNDSVATPPPAVPRLQGAPIEIRGTWAKGEAKKFRKTCIPLPVAVPLAGTKKKPPSIFTWLILGLVILAMLAVLFLDETPKQIEVEPLPIAWTTVLIMGPFVCVFSCLTGAIGMWFYYTWISNSEVEGEVRIVVDGPWLVWEFHVQKGLPITVTCPWIDCMPLFGSEGWTIRSGIAAFVPIRKQWIGAQEDVERFDGFLRELAGWHGLPEVQSQLESLKEAQADPPSVPGSFVVKAMTSDYLQSFRELHRKIPETRVQSTPKISLGAVFVAVSTAISFPLSWAILHEFDVKVLALVILDLASSLICLAVVRRWLRSKMEADYRFELSSKGWAQLNRGISIAIPMHLARRCDIDDERFVLYSPGLVTFLAKRTWFENEDAWRKAVELVRSLPSVEVNPKVVPTQLGQPLS